MKILLLMPVDEQHTVAASSIYQSLPSEARDKCFAMPMFMQYLITTKVAPSWEYGLVDTFYSMRKVIALADKQNDDLILIGNAPKSFHFDAIFNFQDIEHSMPYQDNFLQKVQELVKEDENLYNIVANVYQASDSQLMLHNCAATADFLAEFLASEPNLNKLKEKYKDVLDFKPLKKTIIKE